MPTVYIGVGSNIDPEANIPAAIGLLAKRVKVVGLSTFVRTSPIGCPDSPGFINGVVAIETDIPPRDLKHNLLRGIENSLGRVRTADKFAPRTIDLDIIIYGESVIAEPGLTIPDPDVFTRTFVASPLAELAPGLIVPGSGKRVDEVAALLKDESMTPLDEFTAALRKEVVDES